MNEVNNLLLYKGDSDKGGPEASVRGFMKLDAAMKAMHDHHRKLAAALGIPFDPRTSSGPYTVLTKDGIRMDRHGDHFQWQIIKAAPEDAVPVDDSQAASSGAVLRVTGDCNIPLMSALLDLYTEQPEVLNDISQLLQNNGYEAAIKFLDCCFDL